MNPHALPLEYLVLGSLVFLLASVVRGFTGFGSALVAVPLLALFLDLKLTVVVVTFLAAINGVALTWPVRKTCVVREIGTLYGGYVLGLAVGISALVSLPTLLLKRLFGAFVVFFAARLLLTPTEGNGKLWPARAGWIAGIFSGMAGGAFAAPGPPAVIYLSRRIGDRRLLRATAIVYFLAGDCLRLGSYTATSVISPTVLQATLWFLPASLVGSLIGTRLQVGVGETLFRRCVCVVLLGTGILLVAGR